MNKQLLPFSVAMLLLSVLASAASSLAAPSSTVLVTGVYYDAFVTGEASEAVQLQNVSASSVTIANWKLSDGEGMVTFPNGAQLSAGQKIWVSKSAVTFWSEFGFLPAYEYGADSDADVPNMSGSAPSLTNAGDQVYLKNDADAVIDAMAYGDAPLGAPDWNGAAVQLYDFGSASAEGQILYRKMQEADGLPVPDTA